MNTDYIKQIPVGGFNYDNCIRNKALLESNALGENKLSHMKTGTTICGAIFNVSNFYLYFFLIDFSNIGRRHAR